MEFKLLSNVQLLLKYVDAILLLKYVDAIFNPLNHPPVRMPIISDS